MNKTAIKNFAIWARNKLIADVSYDARLIGITEDGIAKPLPQSFGGTQFFDIGTAEPYSISGEAVRQRDKLIEVIQQKEKDTDYKTAYQYVIEEVAYTWFNRLIAIRFMGRGSPASIRVASWRVKIIRALALILPPSLPFCFLPPLAFFLAAGVC